MESIIIRKMKLDDHISIKNNLFVNMNVDDIEKNVIRNVSAMNTSDSWTYLVAELNDEVVGTLYLEHKTSSTKQHIGELYSIVVADKFRNKGICKKLINNAIEIADKNNIEYLILSVRQGTEAETVYQKLGFIHSSE